MKTHTRDKKYCGLSAVYNLVYISLTPGYSQASLSLLRMFLCNDSETKPHHTSSATVSFTSDTICHSILIAFYLTSGEGAKSQCPDCDFSCNDPASLTRHRKTTHKYQPSTRKSNPPLAPPLPPIFFDNQKDSSGLAHDQLEPPLLSTTVSSVTPTGTGESSLGCAASIQPPPYARLGQRSSRQGASGTRLWYAQS